MAKRKIEGFDATSTKDTKGYMVSDGTSVRVSLDPRDPAFEEWITWEPGDIVTDWPAHADVDGWVKSGHWQASEKED